MKVWYSQVGLGSVRLTDNNTLEIVFGNFSESPIRQRNGRIVYFLPYVYPPYLRSLFKKVLDDLWHADKPVVNDKLPRTKPDYSKAKKLRTLMEV